MVVCISQSHHDLACGLRNVSLKLRADVSGVQRDRDDAHVGVAFRYLACDNDVPL